MQTCSTRTHTHTYIFVFAQNSSDLWRCDSQGSSFCCAYTICMSMCEFVWESTCRYVCARLFTAHKAYSLYFICLTHTHTVTKLWICWTYLNPVSILFGAAHLQTSTEKFPVEWHSFGRFGNGPNFARPQPKHNKNTYTYIRVCA